jgi:hypothetical protein
MGKSQKIGSKWGRMKRLLALEVGLCRTNLWLANC